jgi:hypothetical protein
MYNCNHLGNADVDGRKTETFLLKKYDMRVLNGFNWLRIGPGGRVFQHCNNFRVPQKMRNFERL